MSGVGLGEEIGAEDAAGKVGGDGAGGGHEAVPHEAVDDPLCAGEGGDVGFLLLKADVAGGVGRAAIPSECEGAHKSRRDDAGRHAEEFRA